MPYSFTKIEKDKSRVIGFVFVFLVLFYFLGAWLIYFVSKAYLLTDSEHNTYYPGAYSVSIAETLIVLGVSFLTGVTHWSLATNNLIPRLCGALQAESLNSKDTYHQMFQNIIDEVSVATGGRKIQGVVIPTAAMNAFAIADFNGQAVIGATEGLLTRLSRAQIEAVVGHEAAHIVSGDCLTTTVTVSLFEVYAVALSRMKNMNWRSSGRAGGYVAVLYILIWLITNVSYLLNMLISRERELRADAVAVRLTRDPLSLAGALYSISHRWRGGGIPGEEIKAIFIVNPAYNRLDEGSSWFSDLFSTHPPVKKRLDVLLGMAHADVATLEHELKKTRHGKVLYDPGGEQDVARLISVPQGKTGEGEAKKPGPESDVSKAPATEWIAYKEGQWLGPFTLEQIGGLDWIKPDTWIKRLGDKHIAMAHEDENINRIFQKLQTNKTTALLCPKCRIPLGEISYEGASILKCFQCHGVLVTENDIPRILIREDFSFSERIIKLAEVIKKTQKGWGSVKIDLKTANSLACPHCQHLKARMVTRFYSIVYPVEIDRCVFCGLTWLDKDELEILQWLVEDVVNHGDGQSLDQEMLKTGLQLSTGDKSAKSLSKEIMDSLKKKDR